MEHDRVTNLDDLVREAIYDMAVMHESGVESDRFKFLGIAYVGSAVPVAVFQKQGPLGPDDEDGLMIVSEEGLENPDTPFVLVED